MEEFRFELTDEEKTYLKTLVVQSIRSGLGLAGAPSTPPEPPTDKLREQLGAFVTLKIGGRLRGCIGTIQGGGEAVPHGLAAGAQRGLRGPPVPVPHGGGVRQPGVRDIHPQPHRTLPGPGQGGDRPPRADHVQGRPVGPAPAAGAGGVELGPGDLPGPDLRQGRSAQGRLARSGHHHPLVRGGGFLTGRSFFPVKIRVDRFSLRKINPQALSTETVVSGIILILTGFLW